MTTLSFYIPGQPIPKARARVERNPKTGKVHGRPTTRSEAYERMVQLYARQAVARARALGWDPAVAMSVQITFGKTGARVTVMPAGLRKRTVRGDLDNIAKAILDGMNGVVFNDDRQVSYLRVAEVDDAEADGDLK